MSKTLHKPLFLIIIFILHSFTTIHCKSFNFKKQKLTHLHFYFHDIVTAGHPTSVKVASSPTTNTTRSLFGLVMMTDDPLTVGPEPDSKLVGRAQGLYASADLKELGLLMVLNYCFMEGKYNGSTLSILGRNAVFNPMREMPIVGGTGLFRFARGYAQAKTHSADSKTRNAVVEYNVFVLHY
ncbi:putative dirigent protein [Helianthus annuus]|nr:putative dirigent protein [Helianthus annuus]